ncbi:DUF4224 domain-containing protein [Thioalkalivibrio sp. ALJ8]|uniref:DUF4224 domain-containing protein n=1 Tax=Thioalkalivibrio sp. ALJ8 TaxID=1158757 RepID=UPI0012DC779F|nr:DUF4224 domain-containing protein [Thioalkalivibrio sp. ALJ8]
MAPTGTFLTREELTELTGYTVRKKQVAWLKENGWPFEVAADGRPRVLRAAMLARMGGEPQPNQEPKLRFG